ncbi:MAG: hypothetical protein FJ149_05010 [Euryarchaeota archaeon]|nr:hypothetical protein [Euryarchaeota archaeon]
MYLTPEVVGTTHPGKDGNDPKSGESRDNTVGAGEGQEPIVYQPLPGDETLVDVEAIKEQAHQTYRRLAPSSWNEYDRTFDQFAEHSGLKNYTRKQLATGNLLKRLILNFMDTVPEYSKKTKNAHLPIHIRYGLKLAYPIDTKVDFPKFPRVRRGQTPDNDIVREWKTAMDTMKDPYDCLVWDGPAMYGLRPSHFNNLTWGDIQTDTQGKPKTIIAYGCDDTGKRFKSTSPIGLVLNPTIIAHLEAWRKLHPAPHPENPILPYRTVTGKIPDVKRRMTHEEHWRLWNRFKDTYKLPPLRAKDLRHFASSTGRIAGMSKPAMCLMMGHDPTANRADMQAHYDNVPMDQLLAEQQEKLPNGVIGVLDAPKITIIDGLPSDAIDIVRAYLDGRIGVMDVITKLDGIRLKSAKTHELLAQ